MVPPGTQLGIWTLFVCLSWTFVKARPHYLVVVPTVIESGAESKFCVSLLQPSETLIMTVTLTSQSTETTLLQKTSSTEFHECFQFQAPLVQDRMENTFRVRVQGDTFHSIEDRRVLIKAFSSMTFIQTDKPLYTPGQTVHFRVVSLDSKFRPAHELYNIITMKDSRSNRIGQWLNVTSNGKILQLSFSLNSKAHVGSYNINVWINKREIHHFFKVAKYVLPNFDVKVNVNEGISIAQEEIEVEVCAKYTYGQSVPGSVQIKVCRPLIRQANHEGIISPCHHETKQLKKNGCVTFRVETSTFTKLFRLIVLDELDVFAAVTEEGTGDVRPAWKKVQLSYLVGKVSFEDTPGSLKSASILVGKIKVVNYKGEPVPDKPVYLFNRYGTEALLQNLTTDSNGIATFTMNTSSFQGFFGLRASVMQNNKPQGHLKIPYFQDVLQNFFLESPPSKSVSSLTVKTKQQQLSCNKEERFFIQYTFVGETRRSVDVMYLVLARGTILMQGHQKVKVTDDSVTSGEISFILKVTSEMAPMSEIVAYTVHPHEIIIAHSSAFSSQKCFSNNVSLEFTPASAVPGEENTLQVSAQPGSLCGVTVVDQRVLIEEPGNTLEADKIFNLFPSIKHLSHLPEPEKCLHVRHRRSSYMAIGESAFDIFKNLGLKIATNVLTKMPLCVIFLGKQYNGFEAGSANAEPFSPKLSQESFPMIRTFFPDTWTWSLVEVGDSGTTDLPLTVPDTITTWETEAFCLSPQGFGLAPRKTLTVFQPFFLELSLPYSIIRGEHFELKATVFNYLTSCLMVRVSAEASSDYTLTPLSGEDYQVCVCAHGRKTFTWTMSPTILGVVNVTVSAEAVESHMLCENKIVSVPERGRMDKVTKSLIVKAEGTEKSKTFNWLLCPKGNALTEEVELELPDTVIEGSAQVSVSLLGDILGRALNNLDGLLKMPHGSGEQNIASFASNIFILQYLKDTQQLTKDILEKATDFLSRGYQKQLQFRLIDGSFSTFGDNDNKNTWLTAFVLKSFVQAKSFIFIDPHIINQAQSWLVNEQQPDGCFEQQGEFYNNRIQGGVSDEVTLSAYITAAFLERNKSVAHPAVKHSLSCLRESLTDLNNTYTTALMAYVFTMAGDMETRALLLERLHSGAQQKGEFLYWCQDETETSSSLCVETSSYVLLAKLSASPSAQDMHYCSRIVKWLIGQQNQYGGFSSTQDTAVALQALALYSTKVFSPDSSSTVTVWGPDKQMTFDVNPNNRLLFQEEALTALTGKYSVEVKGRACASMQIVLQYNIGICPQFSIFMLKPVPLIAPTPCTKSWNRLDLVLQAGNRIRTNLVILDIKMLSGFVADEMSLSELRKSKMVDLVENQDDRVLVYCHELKMDFLEDHMITLIKILPVKNLKPAVVKIYDYYEPSFEAVMEYKDPCAAA